MHDIFNHKWLLEVLLALFGVVLVMVSVLLGVMVRFWYMLWDRVRMRVVGWVGARGGTRHSWHKPISIIINLVNSPYHRQFLRWGTSRSAKMSSQILRNLIFIPLTKVASAHRSINYFQIFLVSYEEIN